MPEAFAKVLGDALVARESYRRGTFPEARRLEEACDLVLTKADGLVVSIVAIVDAEADGAKRFALGRDEVVAIAKECRAKYAGRVNGAKMPCTVEIVEVREHVGPEVLQRLQPLRSRFGGVVFAYAVDVGARTCSVNAWSLLNVRRRRIERLLRDPQSVAQAMEPRSEARLPSALQPPIITCAILAVLAAAFVLEQVFPSTPPDGVLRPSVPTLVALGAASRELVATGEWYRLLTACLLHADPFHLLLNGIALYMAGFVLEGLIGKAWVFAVFAIGGLAGSLLSLAINAPDVVSVGASGAICALLATASVVTYRLPEGAERNKVQVRLLQVLVPALLPIAVRSGTRIDFAAHLGGALAGFACGGAVAATWARDAATPSLTPVAKAASILALAAFLFAANQARVAYPDYVFKLIPSQKMPKTAQEISLQAASLVAEYPRDPRAHGFSAIAKARKGDAAGAEAELRAALAEKRVLRSAYTRELEATLRSMLARLLVQQHRTEEARAEILPVCKESQGYKVPQGVTELGLCP